MNSTVQTIAAGLAIEKDDTDAAVLFGTAMETVGSSLDRPLVEAEEMRSEHAKHCALVAAG